MKTIMLLFWVLVGMSVSSQEPYRYLEVVIDKGQAWVEIRPEPVANKTWLEDDCIKTVNFHQFIIAEPAITQPEGFFLVEELDHWQKTSENFAGEHFLNQVPAKSISTLANNLAQKLFGECLCNLPRDKFFLLWLSLTRAVVRTNGHRMHLDDRGKVIQSALTGVWVWNLMAKSWMVQDVRVFVLRDAKGLAVNLLVDAGANIMTKLLICPELYYARHDFSYDLVTKSSKDLKNFVTCKK